MAKAEPIKNSKIFFGFLLSAIYVVFWLFVAFLYFWKGKIEAIFLLALGSLPATIIVSWIRHGASNAFGIGPDDKAILDFASFLIFGSLQYFLLGYLLAHFFRKLMKLMYPKGR